VEITRADEPKSPPDLPPADLSPSGFSDFLKQADAFRISQNYDKIIKEQTEAILFDPYNAKAFRKRAWAHLLKKEYDKAISDYTEALCVTPNDPVTHDRRGTVYLQRGLFDTRSTWSEDLDKAIADFTKVIRLKPSDEAFSHRATAYMSKKDYDKALKDHNEIVRLNPNDAGSYNGRGGIHLLKKDYDKAIEDFTKAIRLGPNNAWILTTAFVDRGRAYAAKKQYGKAIADYEQALRLDPKYSYALGRFAWLLATCPKDEVRDGKRALALATKTCELDNWEECDFQTLAAAYAQCGDFKQAVKWQKKAMEQANELTGYWAPTASDKAELQNRLNLYQKAKPYRDP
jgi:tetratricopeptide (TPR) repeat protein